MIKYFVLVFLLMAVGLSSFSFRQQFNNAPVVDITGPINGSTVSSAGTISYTIEVTDKEDGSSKYEEIPPAEVFLKLKYLPSAKEITAYKQKDERVGRAFTLMKQNNCFNCHSVHQKLSGPSFHDIALKYGASAATYEKLSDKIINGSKGVWGDSQQMPGHPHLNKTDAIALARLVVEYGSEKDFDILTGTEGIIKPRDRNSSPVLLLVASYLDHGIQSADRKEGKCVVTVYPK